MSFPRQGAMKDDDLCAMFDAYIKVVLKNRSRNAVRSYRRQMKHEVLAADIERFQSTAVQEELNTCLDRNTIYVAGTTCVVDNDALYCALCQLEQHHLLPLLLKYWLQWKDENSAEYCGVTVNAIRKRRQTALVQLRRSLKEQGGIISDVGGSGNSKGTNRKSHRNSNSRKTLC